jgi:hypothetical protein
VRENTSLWESALYIGGSFGFMAGCAYYVWAVEVPVSLILLL